MAFAFFGTNLTIVLRSTHRQCLSAKATALAGNDVLQRTRPWVARGIRSSRELHVNNLSDVLIPLGRFSIPRVINCSYFP